jgi:hypothetical protein
MQIQGKMLLFLVFWCRRLDHRFFRKLISAVLLHSLLYRAYAPGSGDDVAALLIIDWG